MKIVRIAIRRPVATAMFYIAVILLGFVSLRQLSVNLLPDISYPRLSVITRYPGVAPEEIETLVTAPLEAALSGIPGMRRIESVSKEGVSSMVLEFAWGTDMDFAMLHIREKLDGAGDTLPEDAEKPIIVSLDPQGKPVLVLALSGDRSLLELKEFAEDLVKPRLEQIEGIGSAEITGGVEREIQVDLNARLLSLFGLTINEVASRIDAFNRNLQGGTIRKGKLRYPLRIAGEFESAEDIGEINLKPTAGGGAVRLKDIARIVDSIKERQGMTRLNGKECIGILVRKESGANTVKVTRLARRVLGEISKENPDIRLQVISEQSRSIEDAISSVKNEIIQGAILAFLVLLIFLQEWRTPLIIDTVIPISVIGTFNLLYFNNVTLNIMSLGGLALGVGMLDDCAVVVSENIFRHRSLGKSLSEAAEVGTREVGMAITATALTTIVVFLPVIYVHGVAGQLFRDQALAVTFSLLSSLLVALTLLPMLLGRKSGNLLQLVTLFFHYLGYPFKPVLGFIFKAFNHAYGRIVERYHRSLEWSLNNKAKVLAATAIFFVATFALGTQIRRELMPGMKTDTFELSLRTPLDYSLEQTKEISGALEQSLRSQKTVKTVFSQVGIVSGLEGINPDISVNSARILIAVDKHSSLEGVLETLRQRLAGYPDLSYTLVREQSTLAEFLAFTPATVGLKLKGDDLEELEALSDELAERLKTVKGITDVNTSYGEGKAEFRVSVREEAMKKYSGLSPGAIADFLVGAVRGRIATQLTNLERKYDILVRLEDASGESLESLLNKTFPHQGKLIPLRELVACQIVRGPREIRRENQQREVLIEGNLNGVKISQVAPAVNRIIAGLSLPPDCRVVFSGEQEEMASSFRSLALALILATLLTYMIMAAQFESLLHPFLVLFTLPMGVSGSIIALFLTGQTINVISAIGLIVLVGIVVDNAIVKIDYTNQLRKAGLALREAVLEGSIVRLRPILMSTLSTLFGLIPMALGLERGAELMQPLAIVVIGGLTFSTFLTLILIPVVYELAEKRKR